MISPFQIKNPVDIHHFRDEISNLNSGQSQIPPSFFATPAACTVINKMVNKWDRRLSHSPFLLMNTDAMAAGGIIE